MCEEYNGWTNRETWATALWIDNEFGLYEQVQQMAKENDSVRGLAVNIEEMFEELFDFDSVFENKDLLIMMKDIGSLYRVNWFEIAKNIEVEKELQEAN